MADCGATGTVLDRAARTMLGGGGGGGDTKQVLTSLMGHATAANQQMASPLPVHAPDQITVPGGGNQIMHQGPAARMKMMQQLPMHHQQPMHHHPQHHQFHPQQQQHHHQQHHMMHQQQHMMAMQQQQQQQQQVMMMQQQQHQQMQMMIQHQKQLQLQQQKAKEASVSTKEAAVQGHEGIVQPVGIEELATAWYEAANQEDVQTAIEHGHEGIVQGAGMEELAAAWAEASEDYQEILDNDNNLWTGETTVEDGGALAPYEFFHPVTEDIELQRAPTESNNTPPKNWMEEGMRHFHAGNLKEAIRSFEMELQLNDSDSANAWRMLGQCHAENDMDQEAITCLQHAVDRDPYCAEALLALGVSHVNELNHKQALENLKAWITQNPKFAGIDVGEDVYGTTNNTSDVNNDNPETAFEEVQRLLLHALDFVAEHNSPEDAAEIWETLGVVYNVSRDYDAAVDALQKAVNIRPDDYQLWNKLGATLANSNQSDKALPHYHKALQLKPKYARAWLNMAISHSNLENYDEAARCYLQTLSLNPAAIHCWSYLRIALSCSERWDLIPAAAAQNLEPFQEYFDFIMYNQS